MFVSIEIKDLSIEAYRLYRTVNWYVHNNHFMDTSSIFYYLFYRTKE